jgi:hypothetical protein
VTLDLDLASDSGLDFASFSRLHSCNLHRSTVLWEGEEVMVVNVLPDRIKYSTLRTLILFKRHTTTTSSKCSRLISTKRPSAHQEPPKLARRPSTPSFVLLVNSVNRSRGGLEVGVGLWFFCRLFFYISLHFWSHFLQSRPTYIVWRPAPLHGFRFLRAEAFVAAAMGHAHRRGWVLVYCF